MCVFAVKRKKAILSDSEDEDEEKEDKPGRRPLAFKATKLRLLKSLSSGYMVQHLTQQLW